MQTEYVTKLCKVDDVLVHSLTHEVLCF